MVDRSALLRKGSLVLCSSIAISVAFVGLLALVTGRAAGIGNRVPLYAVVFSIAFTAIVFSLERHLADGSTILLTAVVFSISTAVVFVLDVEGVLFAIAYPDELVASQLILYFFAAGCLSTGLVYWGVKHWREFSSGGQVEATEAEE